MSVVALAQSREEEPRHQVAENVEAEQTHKGGEEGLGADLGQRVRVAALLVVASPVIDIAGSGQGVGGDFLCTTEVSVVCELVLHQCLVAVLEYREVLELFEEPWNARCRHEETGEQHERNDQHRRQRHCQLLVTERGGDNK